MQGRGEVDGLAAGHLLADGERPLVRGLGLGGVAEDMVDRRQVVEDGRDVRVLGPVGLLRGGEAPRVERARLRGPPRRVEDARERVQARSDDVGVLGAEGLLPDRECRLREGHGLVGPALGAEHPGEVVERRGEPRVFSPNVLASFSAALSRRSASSRRPSL